MLRRPVITRLVLVMCIVVAAGACSGDGGDGPRPEAEGAAAPSTTAEKACTPDRSAKPGTERITVSAGGVQREFERVIPPAFDGAGRLPLIVDLHGFTSTIEQQNLFSNLPAAASERGYVLVTPQAAPATVPVGDEQITAPFWNIYPSLDESLPGAQDDVAFLTELIDDTVAQLCVDDSRIYMTGFSNGAGMTAVMACELGGRLAAIAPVSGFNLADDCGSPEPVSVIAFHGDADPLVDYEGGATAQRPIDSPSIEQRVAQFAHAADCSGEPTVSEPFDDIVLRRHTGCEPGVDVELYTVVGGGHTWPGMLNYVDVEQLAGLGDAAEMAEAYGVDVLTIAGHMTPSIEATSSMLDFFDTHHRP
ncbi:MAG: hypothetical protein M5U19_07550 [Microthrixaceae bacterium]|nr:hypothetical protein [Microthrixaceae bacterium]